MKKILIVLMALLIVITSGPFKCSALNEQPIELVRDTLLTTLAPYISQEISNYYGYSKQFGLYNAKILSIEHEGDGGFTFSVKVHVSTFEHAHNPPIGNETITFQINPSGVKVKNFIHEGDKEEENVNNFYKLAIEDIKESFRLDLDTYESFTYRQLQYKSEVKSDLKPLAKIVENIIDNILNPEIKPPYKNVIDPVTFVKGNKGSILFKRADGTNIVYTVKKKNTGWQIIDRKSKRGKRMKKELIWYM